MILFFFLFAQVSVEELYQSGNYEKLVEVAPLVLAQSGTSRSDSVRLQAYYGSALVALGRRQEAIRVFRNLLAQEPDFALNPERFSPKVRQVFDEAKEEFIAKSGPTKTIMMADTVLVRPKPRLALAIPGLVQIQNKKTVRGGTLLGLGVLSMAGLALSHFVYNEAHEAYLAADTPAEIIETYHTANSWYRIRLILGISAGVVWFYSFADGVFNP